MNRLKELRQEKGLTLKELSKQIDIPIPTLSKYENGDREPKLEMWETIARFYRIAIPFLQGYTSEKNNIGAAILKYNVSENDLAKELNIPLDTLIDWEIQKSAPNLEQWTKLSELLGIGVLYLMGHIDIDNEVADNFYETVVKDPLEMIDRAYPNIEFKNLNVKIDIGELLLNIGDKAKNAETGGTIGLYEKKNDFIFTLLSTLVDYLDDSVYKDYSMNEILDEIEQEIKIAREEQLDK